jgi:hypothetical protein
MRRRHMQRSAVRRCLPGDSSNGMKPDSSARPSSFVDPTARLRSSSPTASCIHSYEWFVDDQDIIGAVERFASSRGPSAWLVARRWR